MCVVGLASWLLVHQSSGMCFYGFHAPMGLLVRTARTSQVCFKGFYVPLKGCCNINLFMRQGVHACVTGGICCTHV